MEPKNPTVENLKTDRDVEGLIRLLEYEDHSIREQAIVALGEIGDVSCSEPLSQKMKDDYLDIRIAACAAFVKMGSKAVTPLIEALKDQNWIVREGAVQALEKIRDPRAVQPLIEAFKDTNRKRVTDALRSVGSASFEPLVNALNSEDSRIRVGAVVTLGEMKNPAAIEPLTKMLQDKDSLVRQFADGAIHRVKRDTSPKKVGHSSFNRDF